MAPATPAVQSRAAARICARPHKLRPGGVGGVVGEPVFEAGARSFPVTWSMAAFLASRIDPDPTGPAGYGSCIGCPRRYLVVFRDFCQRGSKTGMRVSRAPSPKVFAMLDKPPTPDTAPISAEHVIPPILPRADTKER